MHNKSLQERSLFTRSIVLILLLSLFFSLLQGALRNSLTFDEPSHMAAGYAFLQQGKDGLWTVPLRGHPVLFNAWEALSIYIADNALPVLTMEGWGIDRRTFTSEFIHTMKDLPSVTFAVRLPSILCTLLLAVVLWRVATDIWGKTAGFLSIFILCFDPLLLAHGRLATNDVAVTAFGSLYLFITWRWGRKPTWIRSVILGGLLGITMLTKATGIIYGGVGLTWAMWVALRYKRTASSRYTLLWAQVLAMASIAFFVVWMAYGFSFGAISALPNLPVPAPEFWSGTFFQAGNTLKREVYALGLRKTGRWWWYFPFAFIVKNPLPLLLTLFFSPFVFINKLKALCPLHPKSVRKEKNQQRPGLILILLFELLYICAALLIGPNIGYRHFLPVQPSLHLLIAGACYITWRQLKQYGRLLLAGLGVWYVMGTISVFPYEISFFNELAGGPDQGWRYLTTSNTDWLQGWRELYNWQQETGIQFKYSGPEGYLGLSDYGIDFEPLPPVKNSDGKRLSPWLFPLPGDYIVGSSILSGMNIDDVDNYSWFRYRQPDTVIAHSLYYFNVSPEEAPVWVAQCNDPVTPLDNHFLNQGYGEHAFRTLSFDCTESWVYPGGGQSNGHYILHANQLSPETWRTRLHLTCPMPVDSFIARHLDNTPMAARERSAQEFPAFGVYAWSPKELPVNYQSTIPAPAGTSPKDLPAALEQSAFPYMEEGLTLININRIETANVLEVETWWRVEKGPINRPISIMAHLITEQGQTLEISDGLSVSPLVWEPGDIVVQRHIFASTCNNNPMLWLRTGIYWLDTLERWKVNNTNADALFISLCN